MKNKAIKTGLFIALSALIAPLMYSQVLLQANIISQIPTTNKKAKVLKQETINTLKEITNEINRCNSTSNETKSIQIRISKAESRGKAEEVKPQIITYSSKETIHYDKDGIINIPLNKTDSKSSYEDREKSNQDGLVLERGRGYIRIQLSHKSINKLFGEKTIEGEMTFFGVVPEKIINDPNGPFEYYTNPAILRQRKDIATIKGQTVKFKTIVSDEKDSVYIYYNNNKRKEVCEKLTKIVNQITEQTKQELLPINWESADMLSCAGGSRMTNNKITTNNKIAVFCKKNTKLCKEYKDELEKIKKTIIYPELIALTNNGQTKQVKNIAAKAYQANKKNPQQAVSLMKKAWEIHAYKKCKKENEGQEYIEEVKKFKPKKELN